MIGTRLTKLADWIDSFVYGVQRAMNASDSFALAMVFGATVVFLSTWIASLAAYGWYAHAAPLRYLVIGNEGVTLAPLSVYLAINVVVGALQLLFFAWLLPDESEIEKLEVPTDL
ncbi:hypothetical protein [Halomontanus rarus]|uniref:hypothetical protein n=1 Tax=Halomontanus rarus TaxID=3034020 RepID=UPI00307BC360